METTIGILGLTAAKTDKPLKETLRLATEIRELGHTPVFINYRRSAIGVTEMGRALYTFDSTGDCLKEVAVDAVIPRIGNFVECGTLALRLLELNGTPTMASSFAIATAKDKIKTQIALDHAGIPTPFGLMPIGRLPSNKNGLLRTIQPDPKGRVIIKSPTGSHGMGVIIAESRNSARSIIDDRIDNPFILQEFVEPVDPSRGHDDIRIVVVRNQIVTAMRRFSEPSEGEEEFRANLSLGGNAEPYEPTQRESEMAINAAKAVGLEISGIDMMHSTRGPLVTEVNDNLEFGIEKITKVNVAAIIAQLAIEKALQAKSILAPTEQVVIPN